MKTKNELMGIETGALLDLHSKLEAKVVSHKLDCRCDECAEFVSLALELGRRQNVDANDSTR